MLSLDIGRRISHLRKENNIRQGELAAILAVSTQAVSKWESGSCYPDIELLPAIAEFFNVSTDYLLGVQEKTIQNNKYISDDSLHELYSETDNKNILEEAIGLSERLLLAKKYSNRSIDYYYKAESEYLKIIAETENNRPSEYYQAHEQLIHMYCRDSHSKQCIDTYKKKCETEADEWKNYYLLGLAYYQSKKFKESWDTIKNVLNKGHEYVACYHLAGNVCKALGLYNEALEYYKKAYEMDTGSCSALYSQAYLYEKLYRFNEAINMWKCIVEWIHENSECENNELDWPLVKITELSKKLSDQ